MLKAVSYKINKSSRYILGWLLLLCGFHPAYSQLQANFTINQAAGCSPLIVNFTSTTTGASSDAIFQWDFGNGNTSELKNPHAVFIEETSYTVTLTVKDGTKTSSKQQVITVYKKPTVAFTADILKGCAPLPVTLTSQSTAGNGNIISYFWDYGDGSTQSINGNGSTTHTYTVAQNTAIGLTVTNNYGCHSTLYKNSVVNVLPVIKAEFTANQTFICKINDPVSFTNTSVGPGTLSYEWDFGDGTRSTDKAPSYTFNKKGTYDVSLKVTSSEGCTSIQTQTSYLNVGDFSSAIIDEPAPNCTGQLLQLTSQTNPKSYSTAWDLPGYGAGSSYSGSSESVYYFIYTPDDYTVRLINTFGTCKDTVYKVIKINPTPRVEGFLNGKDIYCSTPQTIQFKDTSVGDYTYRWDFNYSSGSTVTHSTLKEPTWTFPSGGIASVALFVTSKEGCTGQKGKILTFSSPEVYIYQTQQLGPYGPGGCKGAIGAYIAYSNRPIAKYHWTFSDDGSTSDVANPSHSYTKTGHHTITLEYESIDGCKGTVYYYNDIYDKPAADFISSLGQVVCGNTPVTFKSTTATNNGWYWDFGDGIFYPGSLDGSRAYRIKQYEQEGEYTIRAIAINEGCADTITKVNYLKVQPPFVKIDKYFNTCEGSRGEVTFIDSSKMVTNWSWDFGDGNTQTHTAYNPQVRHTYTNTGSYKIMLTGTNGQCSVKDSTNAPVLLKQQPGLTTLEVEACNSIKPLTVIVDNLVRNPGYYIPSVHYEITNFLDENNNSLPLFVYGTTVDVPPPGRGLSITDFPANGTQQFRVITTSAYFYCQDTTNLVTVKIKGPRAGYSVAPSRCLNQPTLFNDTSKGYNNVPIVSWQWNFGDGPLETYDHGGIIPHLYTSAYSYQNYLKVTDAEGCSNETRTSYLPITGLRASFSSSVINVVPNSTINFTNTSFLNYYNETDIEYKWLLDNSAFATTKDASYNFTLPGVYTVLLVVTNPSYSCSDTMRQTITVKYVNSAFRMNSARLIDKNCLPVLVNFTNISSNAVRVLWEFGDGSIAENNFNPSHLYHAPGKYIITLHVFSDNGTEYITLDSVIINQPQIAFQVDKSEGCIGHTVTLQADNQFTTQYTWDFGDGNISQQPGNKSMHTYTLPGNYTPSLLMKGENGCLFPAVSGSNINIHPNPVITISPAQPFVCLGKPLLLNASGGVSYVWTPAEGLDNNTIPNPTANPTVTTTYKVQVTDAIGCKNEKSVTVGVHSPFNINLNPSASVCQGDALTLKATGAYSYRWINNITGLDNASTATPVARPAANAQYTVVGYDVYNCFTDTAQTSIIVYPKPSVQASNDVEVLAGTPVPLSVSSADNIINWNWSPADYLSCTSCNSPVSIPKSEVTYTVTGKDNNGCQASDQVHIKIQCEESRVAIPNGFTPNGDGKNDLFVVKGISYIKHLTIYNRWGNKIFERSNFIAGDPSNCWDGTHNGMPQPEGSYVYFIEMQCPDGGAFTRRGTITLLR